jgi:hypothetical protein
MGFFVIIAILQQIGSASTNLPFFLYRMRDQTNRLSIYRLTQLIEICNIQFVLLKSQHIIL